VTALHVPKQEEVVIMTARRFSPFKNETDSVRIGNLTIENRLNRISLKGSLEITLDQVGLEKAQVLMEVLSLVMHEMAHSDLPVTIAAPPCR